MITAYMRSGMKVRIGRDWFARIFCVDDTDGSPADFSLMKNITVTVKNQMSSCGQSQNYTISGNTINFQWDRTENVKLGTYDIVIEYDEDNASSENGTVHNAVDLTGAFKVVPISEKEENADQMLMCAINTSMKSLASDVTAGKALIINAIRKQGVETEDAAAFVTLAKNVKDIGHAYRLKYLQLDNNGEWEFVDAGQIVPGQKIEIKKGSDITENNVGSKDYVPDLLWQAWSCPYDISSGYLVVPDDNKRDIILGANYVTKSGNTIYVDIDGNVTEKPNYPTLYKCYFGNITSIDYNFNGCIDLQTLTMPDGPNKLYYSMFQDCINLKYVVVPKTSITVIDRCFQGCYALQSIVIPEGVTSIGIGAFGNCYALQSIVIPEGVTSIGSGAFGNCYALQSIVIPEGVTSIGSEAFRNCYALQSIVIPEGVTSIGSYAFEYCYALQSIVIPEGVTSIDSGAFDNCYALQSIVIPSTVTVLADSLFYACKSLKNLVTKGVIASIGDSLFN